MVAGVLIDQFGCTRMSARRGGEILALLASREPIDLVVVDVNASGGDEALSTSELIGTLGTGQPPVVALADMRAAPGQGFRFARLAGTVAKPYSPRELFGAMQAALKTPAAAISGTA
jgi:CheY-like chemotaxis protein